MKTELSNHQMEVITDVIVKLTDAGFDAKIVGFYAGLIIRESEERKQIIKR